MEQVLPHDGCGLSTEKVGYFFENHISVFELSQQKVHLNSTKISQHTAEFPKFSAKYYFRLCGDEEGLRVRVATLRCAHLLNNLNISHWNDDSAQRTHLKKTPATFEKVVTNT